MNEKLKESKSGHRKPIEGPAVWYGAELRESGTWIREFTPSEIEELDTAVDAVRRRGCPLTDVERGDFPLPTLGPVLKALRDELVEGRGFVLLRGVPVTRYSTEEAITAFWGLGSHVGWAIPQNAKGHLLGHVRDIGLDPSNPVHRIYGTRARHLYHTDSCDIVGLLCLQKAKSGGMSSIASSVTVYNEMLRRRPDLVEILARPLVIDRKGEVPVGKDDVYDAPVFNLHAGALTTMYNRDFIEAAQRFDRVPRLSDEQIEAMDLLDELADSDEICLRMDLQPGDVQLIHNHQVLHARTPYEDHPEPERKRHLLRIWLAPANGRELPPVFEERYGNIEPGTARGGIRVPGQELNVPLKPV